MTPDERAGQLAGIVLETAARIRDENPSDVHRWLASVMPDGEWMAAFVVACSVIPTDRAWSELVSWVTWPDGGPPPVGQVCNCRRDVDEVAVERACQGELLPLNRRERQLAVAKLRNQGMNRVRIAAVLGLSRRTVQRLDKAAEEEAVT